MGLRRYCKVLEGQINGLGKKLGRKRKGEGNKMELRRNCKLLESQINGLGKKMGKKNTEGKENGREKKL